MSNLNAYNDNNDENDNRNDDVDSHVECSGDCHRVSSSGGRRSQCADCCQVSAPLLASSVKSKSKQRLTSPSLLMQKRGKNIANSTSAGKRHNNKIPKTTLFHGLGLYYLVGASHQQQHNHYLKQQLKQTSKYYHPPQPLPPITDTPLTIQCATTCQSNYIGNRDSIHNNNRRKQSHQQVTYNCWRQFFYNSQLDQQHQYQYHHQQQRQQQEPQVNRSGDNDYHRNASRTMKVGDYDVNIRTLGIAFFVLASIFCVYGILTFKDDHIPKSRYVTELKLVSLFNRHGDRAPSDALPINDPHRDMYKFFWPNGLSNLTDAGKLRQYKLGLETRRHYSGYLDYNASQILVYSSPMFRCIQSVELTLRGLFDIGSYKEKNLKKQYECYLKQKQQSSLLSSNHSDSKGKDANKKCLPSGAGSPDEYKKVLIDTQNMPALIYEFLNNCKYRKENPSPVDVDITNSPEIKKLPGIELLRTTLMERYNQSLNFSSISLWSTIESEMDLVRTEETIQYAKHYLEWVNKPIVNDTKSPLADITLFDLYEAATVLGYRDRVVDTALRVQIGPIIASVIESQQVALTTNSNSTFATSMSNSISEEQTKKYQDKKMIIYSGHDSIMQLILNYMGVINFEGTFEQRFHKLKKTDDELSKFLNGIRMCSYGMSFRLELYQTRIINSPDTFAYIQLSIYNRNDAKFHDVDYPLVPFGSICRRKFVKKYPRAKNELSRFYPYEFQTNQEFNCPYELFKNITADIMIDRADLKRICDY